MYNIHQTQYQIRMLSIFLLIRLEWDRSRDFRDSLKLKELSEVNHRMSK